MPPRSGVADPFNIELVFPAKERLGNFEKTVTRQAAAEWEMVILEGLPAEGDIDDIRITVGWLKDDEPLCQNAIACRVDTEARHGSHLPYEGTVYSKFPVKYRRGGVPSLRDTLENRYIMVHEIGHALGLVGSLSTSWRLGLLGDLNDGDPFWAKDSRIVNRPFFGGVLAAVFYDRMVGDLFRGEHVFRGFPMTVLGVPLEGWGKQRGSRVQAVHWAWPELCGAAVSVNHCGEYLPPHGRTEQDFPERFWTGRAVSDLDAAALGDLGYVTKIEGVRQLALNE
ncbi:MAG: hypothetical protein OXN90_08040 [Gemmatimonadota bacterium]|nr:hypothetical protein [Gemmatimonadota bacterium]